MKHLHQWLLAVIGLSLSIFAGGCSFSVSADGCSSESDCLGARVCVDGFCADPTEARGGVGEPDGGTNQPDGDESSDGEVHVPDTPNVNNQPNNDTPDGGFGGPDMDGGEDGFEPEPCLAVSPKKIDFGLVPEGETVTETFTVQNCSSELELRFDNASAVTSETGGMFEVKRDPSWPVRLEPNGEISITVTYFARGEKTDQGKVIISSNAPGDPEVELVGRTEKPDCPQPLIAADGSETGSSNVTVRKEVLNTITLSGEQSNTPNGSIAKYEWTIVARPEDSLARVTPDAGASEVDLYLDRPGDYRVELAVYDTEGNSCHRARANIEAYTDNDVYLELTWETPNDSNKYDQEGADLDLHYLNPKGQWNRGPYDIYWRNGTADWGADNDPSDDPKMVVGNSSGSGPEVVQHDNLVSGNAYTFGVYYYDDKGFGTSYATVRLYRDGQLKHESKDKTFDESFQFWKVAAVEWPTGTVYPRNQMYDGFPTD